MLFSYPELEVEDFVDEEITQDLLEWYDTFIIKFYESTKRNLRLGEGNVVEAVTAEFTPEAKIEYKRIHKEITSDAKVGGYSRGKQINATKNESLRR